MLQGAGNLGSYIVDALLAGGKHTVTAITREGSAATFPDAVHRQPVDYSSHDSLVNALRGQQFLIIILSVRAPPDSQEKLILAAKDAGVQWIMPSEYGTDYAGRPDVGAETKLGPPALAIRQAITDAGLNFVALSCGIWYEFSLGGGETRFGFDLKKREATFYDDGSTKVTTSTWPQCGRAIAALLALPIDSDGEQQGQTTLSQFRNKSAFIGSFHVSQKEIFASILRSTGTNESDWSVKNEPVKERYARGNKMLAEGNFWGFGIALYARLFYPDGAADLEAQLANKALALPSEDLDEATRRAIGMAEKGEFDH